MTAKTKQQLRAEAVERLKNSEYHTALDDICSMLGWGHEPHFEGATDALIDLLTDDANDDLAHESDVRTVSVDANDVKVSTMPLKMPSEIRWHYTDGGEYTQKLTGDSREKLEAAAGELTADYAASGEVCDSMYNGIIELLDRQAAITAEETSNAWEEYRDATQLEIAKYEHDCELLFDEKRELTVERDKMQEQLRIGWECECRLQAERERYREKFGKCLDYADAIHALMDDEGMA